VEGGQFSERMTKSLLGRKKILLSLLSSVRTQVNTGSEGSLALWSGRAKLREGREEKIRNSYQKRESFFSKEKLTISK